MAIDYNNPAYGTFLNATPKAAAPTGPLQFNTTRAENGALTTSTPGYEGPAPQGEGFGDVISKILANRQAARPAVAAQPSQMQPAARAAVPQYAEAPQMYSPEFGAEPVKRNKQQPATRMRRVRSRTPIPSMLDQQGITFDDVPEYQLPDGTWSLDAVHGTLGGNEAAARQHMAVLDRQGTVDYGSPSLDPRLSALTAAQKKATEIKVS